MDFLAHSVIADANENPVRNKINIPKVKFNLFTIRNSAWLAMAGLLVVFGTLGQVSAASAAQLYVRTNGSCLKVRTAPSTRSQIVGCVRNGAALAPVVGYRNGFARLSTGNYVAANFISSRRGTGNTPGLGVGGSTVLDFGSQGEAVRQVQRALGIPATGYYGTQTKNAVRSFQVSNGLTSDGVVGPATRRALLNNSGGVGGPVVLSFGSQGRLVSQVQEALGIPATGYYGRVTESAVRDFQSVNGLRVTGTVNTETRRALGLQRRFTKNQVE